MNMELKDEIIKTTQNNVGDFQLTNNIIGQFKEYIYDSKGEYLIGGKEVADFIVGFIKLYESK